jgi:hypothetical protein
MVVDLGNQRVQSQMYGDKIKPQVYVAWELPDEQVTWTDRDGNERTGPMRIGKTYTVSLHENANLRADLESWRGRPFTEQELEGFDITKLGGVPCLINVAHKQGGNGKTYANVVAVTPLPKSMEKPTCSDLPLIYDDEHVSSFELLPEWLQKKIQEQVSEQREPETRAPAFDRELEDEIPF